ncbi:MAG: hypothetical protein ACK5L3_06420, partial [Oscillospiraceae bacterium]
MLCPVVHEGKAYGNTKNVCKECCFFNATTQTEGKNFCSNIRAFSLYGTGVSAEYGGTFLTLPACDGSVENGRFVVVAKLILPKFQTPCKANAMCRG